MHAAPQPRQISVMCLADIMTPWLTVAFLGSILTAARQCTSAVRMSLVLRKSCSSMAKAELLHQLLPTIAALNTANLYVNGCWPHHIVLLTSQTTSAPCTSSLKLHVVLVEQQMHL